MTTYKHKLRAFTIVETMVALVLTALAISFAYAAIRFIQRQSDTLTGQLDHYGEFNRLHRALQADVERADEIRYNATGVAVYSGKGAIQYLASDSLCIRHEGTVVDTFRIGVDSVTCWFAGQRLETAGQVADQGIFWVSTMGNPQSIVISKWYDAATLIELTQPTE